MKKLLFVLLLVMYSISLFATGAENLVIIGFKDMDRDSRYITNIMESRDIRDVFGKSEHFRLIHGREVTNAIRALKITTSVDLLSSDQATQIGEKLNASMVVWGQVNRINDTQFRITGSMLSQRTGSVRAFSMTVTRDRNQRQNALRSELQTQLYEFSKGEMNRMFAIAEQQYLNENLENAERLFQNIVNIDPNNVDAYFYLGRISFDQNRMTQAIDHFVAGLEKDPNSEKILRSLSIAYRIQGRLADAIDCLERVAVINPDKIVYLHIAMMQRDRNMISQAFAALDYAMAIDPDYLEGHDLYADIAYANQMFDIAITHLEFLTNAQPEDDEYARKLAISYQRTGQLDKAIERYQAIIASDRTNLRAHQNLSAAYRTLAVENVSESTRFNRLALAALQEAAKIAPTNASIEVGIADIHFALNDMANAERFANSARQKQANLPEASTILGAVAQKRGIDRYNSFVELQNRTDSGGLFGKQLDDTIALRDKTKSDAHTLFNAADRHFREALGMAENERLRSDINAKIQGNRQYIELTRPDFF
jgi:tetratricopeptide (TPR) repeat protein